MLPSQGLLKEDPRLGSKNLTKVTSALTAGPRASQPRQRSRQHPRTQGRDRGHPPVASVGLVALAANALAQRSAQVIGQAQYLPNQSSQDFASQDLASAVVNSSFTAASRKGPRHANGTMTALGRSRLVLMSVEEYTSR